MVCYKKWGGEISYTIPYTGNYEISLSGAQGEAYSNGSGGYGYTLSKIVRLHKGDILGAVTPDKVGSYQDGSTVTVPCGPSAELYVNGNHVWTVGGGSGWVNGKATSGVWKVVAKSNPDKSYDVHWHQNDSTASHNYGTCYSLSSPGGCYGGDGHTHNMTGSCPWHYTGHDHTSSCSWKYTRHEHNSCPKKHVHTDSCAHHDEGTGRYIDVEQYVAYPGSCPYCMTYFTDAGNTGEAGCTHTCHREIVIPVYDCNNLPKNKWDCGNRPYNAGKEYTCNDLPKNKDKVWDCGSPTNTWTIQCGYQHGQILRVSNVQTGMPCWNAASFKPDSQQLNNTGNAKCSIRLVEQQELQMYNATVRLPYYRTTKCNLIIKDDVVTYFKRN